MYTVTLREAVITKPENGWDKPVFCSNCIFKESQNACKAGPITKDFSGKIDYLDFCHERNENGDCKYYQQSQGPFLFLAKAKRGFSDWKACGYPLTF